MSATAWLAFLAAAAVGACARYTIDGVVRSRFGGTFPRGILLVNVSGCLALGVLTGLGLYHGAGSTTQTVLGSGGLGAYTTFSTFTLDTVRLTEDGDIDGALRNVVLSLLLGLAAASAGLALTALA